ncbi:MAG: 6-phosphofructokinase 1 [Lysobacterales bacterium]|jgi:6-phosphofructokinase 1
MTFLKKKNKKVAILTSGGDGPGMNAAIRSAVRCGISKGYEMVGIMHGYKGVLNEDIIPLNHRSVSNIISRGGTILKTARCSEFRSIEGKKKGVEILRKHGIDALIVIGGDGTYQGATALWEECGFPVIGLPGTIDNDINGTDETIGCYTAVNTALDAIDKIRDTSHSMERVFVIEVMGNRSGYIALEVAVAAGAENVIIPEREFDYEGMCDSIKAGHKQGKVSWMIIVAEGAGNALDVSNTVKTMTGLESRYVVLGHVQRGGTPSGQDRILATRLGAAAIDLIEKEQFGKAVGVLQDEINIIDLKDATHKEFKHIEEFHSLVKVLT